MCLSFVCMAVVSICALAAKIRTTTTSRSPNLQIYKLLDTLCLLKSTDVYSCLLMSTIAPTRCRIFAEYFGKAPPHTHRSVSVRPSFILRSTFVHPSFVLRSGFVRASFGKRKQTKTKRRNNKKTKNLKPQNLKHNGNAKRYHLKNQWFCRQSYLQADRWSNHRSGKSRAECATPRGT